MPNDNEKVTLVSDRKAENWINLGALIQGLILIAIVALGDNVISSVDKLGVSVEAMSRQIAIMTTTTTVNALKIDNNSSDIKDLQVMFSKHMSTLMDSTKDKQ